MAKRYEFIVKAVPAVFEKTIWEDGLESSSTCVKFPYTPIAAYIFEGTLKDVAAERDRLADEVKKSEVDAVIWFDMRDDRERKPAGFKAEKARKVNAVVNEIVKDYRAA